VHERFGDDDPEWGVRELLASVIRTAMSVGARRLIGVTYQSMARLFRRLGVQAHLAGPAQRIDGRMVAACWIDLDARTLGALDIDHDEQASPAAFGNAVATQ
jgi:acyl homoserine lactone synthase